MREIAIESLYFDWLFDHAMAGRPKKRNYTKLLKYLHSRMFHWAIPMDENRYFDGIDLRDEFFDWCFSEDIVLTVEEQEKIDRRFVSVLEVLVALARRCEYDMVGDDLLGDRGAWFMRMISNLGLTEMDNQNFDEEMVSKVIDIFLDRKYESDGVGNIFYIRNDPRDFREVDIWCQLCWYVDYLLKE